MTLKKFAKQCAEQIKKNPTRESIQVVVQKIQHLTIEKQRPINNSEIDEIISYMDEELSSLYCIMESFENKEQLSVMQQVHEIIDKARKENANG